MKKLSSNTKQLALGIVVALVAVGTSAYTNASKHEKSAKAHHGRLATFYYVTGTTTISGPGGGPAYTLSTTSRNCVGTTNPCQIESASGGTLSSPILQSTVNNASMVTIDSRQNGF